MKRIFIFIFLSLLSAGTAFAEESPDNLPADTHLRQSNHTPVGINLSLWKNVATQRTDTIGSTCLNLGLFSSMNRLNGLGLNVLGGVVGRDVNGVQAAGVANLVGGSMRGIQVAGITNINGNGLAGLSLSGLVSITNNNAQGVVLSGLANIVGDNSRGVTFGGLLNLAGDNASGVHLSCLADVSGELAGVSVAGLLSVVGKDFKGAQLAGIANITAEDMTGVQISAIGNVAGGTARGLQLGAANVATRAKGLQIGLFNYYKESLDGFQLGLVNANPDTKVQMMLFAGSATKLNVAARFKNKLFYTILGGGTHYLDFNDKFSASFFYRAGLELPLYKQLFISGDLGYQHIETFKNKSESKDIPGRLFALQTRVNIEYRMSDGLGIFLSLGYGRSRFYNKNKTFDRGLIVEGGVVLFKY